MDKKERREKIREIFDESLPNTSQPESYEKGRTIKINGGRDFKYVDASGQLIIDRRRTVIINNARCSDEQSTTELQTAISTKKKGKVSLICLVGVALILVLPLSISQAPSPELPYMPSLQPAVAIPGELPLQMPDVFDSESNYSGSHYRSPGCSTMHINRMSKSKKLNV